MNKKKVIDAALAMAEVGKVLDEPEQLALDIPANRRESILKDALEIVSHDRNVQYGDPEQNFQAIANLWYDYLEVSFDPHDVAVMLLLVKVARIKQSPTKMDHWVDIAGYAACGGEVAGNK